MSYRARLLQRMAPLANLTCPRALSSVSSDQVSLKPSEIVQFLDKHIIGQTDAKRAVAIALRNRWRRHRISSEFTNEIIPKNILMIGPTGCGKTEIARRLSLLSQAPFVKVEATKFTEVGYHGKDVDHIIRDLVEIAMGTQKKRQAETHRDEATKAAELTLLNLFGAESPEKETFGSVDTAGSTEENVWLSALRNGDLDDKEIEIEVPVNSPDQPSNNPAQVIFTMMSNSNTGGKVVERKRMSIKDARPIVEEQELARLIDSCEGDVTKEAIKAVENNGIVFIDEIDKICSSRDFSSSSADASAEGVQRDLLPLIEGSTVNTKHGNVVTDHILFICSGAFHAVKPSDLMAELQGRLPIRVELERLTENDMYRILTEPVANLVVQQQELMATEGVKLVVEDDALREIARLAVVANKLVENIGARRLHAILEAIMEDISYEASSQPDGTTITISKFQVEEKMNDLVSDGDFARHIL